MKMSRLPVLVLALCLFLGTGLCEENGEDVEMDEMKTKTALQIAADAKKNQEKTQGTGGDTSSGTRKKRQVFGFGNYFGRFAGNGYLGDTVYDPPSYLGRLPYLPDASLSRFNNLPIFRFFNQFSTAGLVRTNNLLVRNYVRFNSGVTEALTDFRLLPVYNVREIAATTVHAGGPDLEAAIYGTAGGRIRLLRRGCSLNGFNNVYFPCLDISLPSPLFGNVYRRFTYFTGLNTGLGPNGIPPFVAK